MVFPVKVQTANHCTKGDCCLIHNQNFDQIHLIGKKSGPSREPDIKNQDKALGCTFLSRFLCIAIDSEKLLD